jgi:hypothetical protein
VAEQDGNGDPEINFSQPMIGREPKFEKHKHRGQKYGTFTAMKNLKIS